MKIRFFAIMFAATMFAALSASTTHGQTSQGIQVEVPFAFTAYKKVLPAGSYRIESVSGTQVLWRIRGSRKKRSSFLLAMSVAGTTSRGDLRVMFHRYGDKLFLAGFKTSSYEVTVPVSRRERTLKMAQALVPSEIINVETVTGGSR